MSEGGEWARLGFAEHAGFLQRCIGPRTAWIRIEAERERIGDCRAKIDRRAVVENDIDVPFYVRFVVKDRAGIVGDIGRTFGRIGVNISEIWQLRHVEEEIQSLKQTAKLKQKYQDMLPFVMTLERTTLRQMRKALDSIRNRDYIVIDPVWFPIWGGK